MPRLESQSSKKSLIANLSDMFKSVKRKSTYVKLRRQLLALNILLATSQKFRFISRELLSQAFGARPIAFVRAKPLFCQQTGRVGGSVALFGLSRFRVKKLAELGLLPGVRRLS